MKFNNMGVKFRKWCRLLHRDISFFFSGMVMIYAISGIAMNHRDTINPNYSIERLEYKLEEQLPTQKNINKEHVLNMLKPLEEDQNYTKHYFPQEGQMKVFLKGGSNVVVDINTGQVVYEKLTRRPLLSAMTKLHYNPGQWWTYFADFFAIGLLLITWTGLLMLKGRHGLWGIGGIELLAGILIPLLFLFL